MNSELRSRDKMEWGGCCERSFARGGVRQREQGDTEVAKMECSVTTKGLQRSLYIALGEEVIFLVDLLTAWERRSRNVAPLKVDSLDHRLISLSLLFERSSI
jgi:hypothetical protein